MGRWTDSTKVREGLVQIGYDRNTRTYTFRDEHGHTFNGAPGDSTGHSIDSPLFVPAIHRPMFDTDAQTVPRVSAETPPTSFQDILPPHLITSPGEPVDTSKRKSPKSSPKSKFIGVVRRVTTSRPKMRGVVDDLVNRKKLSGSYKRLSPGGVSGLSMEYEASSEDRKAGITR